MTNETQRTTMNRIRSDDWSRLLLILVLLSPLAIMFLLPGGGLLTTVVWFWMGAMLTLCVLWMLLGGPPEDTWEVKAAEPRVLHEGEQPQPVREVMDIQAATEQMGVKVFRGKLRDRATTVYEKLKRAFSDQTVPLIQEDPQHGAAIALVPKPVEQATLERPVRPWVHWLLFGLTVLTTTWAGAAHQGVNLLREPERFAAGLPYSLGLLAILGVHELGHYFTARLHGMKVTPPYFIPVPFALGTFGAFIQMRSPAENR
ncbi:MAG: site-2 protease family protein, partial [Acidobacteria bacterium]|nr:site-2 protease family protein [Acidobacteriota bacterium]